MVKTSAWSPKCPKEHFRGKLGVDITKAKKKTKRKEREKVKILTNFLLDAFL